MEREKVAGGTRLGTSGQLSSRRGPSTPELRGPRGGLAQLRAPRGGLQRHHEARATQRSAGPPPGPGSGPGAPAAAPRPQPRRGGGRRAEPGAQGGRPRASEGLGVGEGYRGRAGAA